MSKRNIILVFIFSAFISAGAGAAELWNGFTTDMNRDQVIARARTALGTGEFSEIVLDDYFPSRRITVFYGNSDRANLNNQFPVMESGLKFKSPLAQYNQRWDNNINFYFYNGRLFGVRVEFTASDNDFIPLARNQYGTPSQTIVETNRGTPGNSYNSPFQRTWYVWRTSEKTVYVPGPISGSPNVGRLHIFSTQVIVNFQNEREEADAQRRAETTSGIQF